jgi:hypothetical protein
MIGEPNNLNVFRSKKANGINELNLCIMKKYMMNVIPETRLAH